MSAKKILLTGASGMLAADLIPRLQKKGVELFLSDVRTGERCGQEIHSVDITEYRCVDELVEELRPAWIINCAAYTAVDRAEEQEQVAFEVNGEGAGNLAKAAAAHGAKLLHVSTDYLYGGPGCNPDRNTPYKEYEPPRPCGAYGRSKRYGDELVMKALPEGYVIVRTSWLHGVHGPNFIHSILRLAEEREELKVVDDQIGSPTWTGWLADVIIKLIEGDARGIFHATSRGNISWCEFAKEIVQQAGLEVRILPQTTQELARPAPRPPYSTLDIGKLEEFLGEECLSWKECVRSHLEAMEEGT